MRQLFVSQCLGYLLDYTGTVEVPSNSLAYLGALSLGRTMIKAIQSIYNKHGVLIFKTHLGHKDARKVIMEFTSETYMWFTF